MKIKSVHLRHFKRFTNLVIQDIPQTARLVVLMGPNGSGKSSIFDAFNIYLNHSKGNTLFFPDYHVKEQKDVSEEVKHWHDFINTIKIEFHDEISSDIRLWNREHQVAQKAFYIRSSYRHEADFSANALARRGEILLDANRPQLLISPDQRVSENYERMVASAIESVFEDTTDTLTAKAVRERLTAKVNEALGRVFGDIMIDGVGKPLENGTFFFKKGITSNWKYKNLSGGEKAAFDLLLDFCVKREKYDDTVFCIDEPEVHLHATTQGQLLEELVTLLPSKCQLWISTHSVGTIRRAKELSEKKPGEVVFLDFADRNFENILEIRPAITNRGFWKRSFSGVLGDLANLIAPSHIFCCEGAPMKSGEFDAKCFRRIFEQEFPDAEYISLGSATELEKNILITSVFRTILPEVKVCKVRDRDDLGPSEVEELRKRGIKVLSRRHLEGYLYDDEIIGLLCKKHGKPDKLQELLQVKKGLEEKSVAAGYPYDDMKRIAGPYYVEIKKRLGLNACGNTAQTFCVDALAPLVTPETKVYQSLKTDLFAV